MFSTKAWAYSATQVDWKQEGYDGAKLAYLLAGQGLFHDGHRAAEDCHGLLEVLSRPLLMSGELGLKRLLDTAHRSTWQIWAENSPFEAKDRLKARGYRWNDGTDGRPKAWWTDVSAEQKEEELRFLRTEIYQHDSRHLHEKCHRVRPVFRSGVMAGRLDLLGRRLCPKSSKGSTAMLCRAQSP